MGVWKIYGISLDAVDVYQAYLTPGNQDDLTLAQAALAGHDTIQLSPYADKFRGFGGNDTMTGGAGSDTLLGDGGKDKLTGGHGKDALTGGSGTDLFVFAATAESGLTATTADVIADFVRGQDRIDLQAIDAFAASGGNDAFVWRGDLAFASATKGEIRFQKIDQSGTANDCTMVYLDTDADSAAEMAIRLTGLVNLTQSDFLL